MCKQTIISPVFIINIGPLQNRDCNPCTINGRIGTSGSDHPYIAYGFKKSKSVRYIWMIRAKAPYSSMYSARIAISILEGVLCFLEFFYQIRPIYASVIFNPYTICDKVLKKNRKRGMRKFLKSVHYLWNNRTWGLYCVQHSVRIAFSILEGLSWSLDPFSLIRSIYAQH